ncbi:MAG: EamA family transporter [Rhodococcus sp. (in: high G+C Gram-positive bacteria)]
MTNSRPANGSRTTGIAAALGGALSNQLGAASGSMAFPVVGPVGVVAVRQIVAAAILLPLVRPRVRSLTRAQWWPVLLLASVFGSMNLTLYLAIERIGLGLAVTLEFCGPLAVALLGARTRTSAFCALVAGAGVLAITRPQATTDYIGIGLGLVAACSWAGYILLNRTVGSRIPGIQGTATATGVSAVLFLPVGAWILVTTRPDPATLFYAVGAGVLASAVPFVADLIALRRIPTTLFGILMSLNPVLAAVIGAMLLQENLGAAELLGIALIVTANTAALIAPSASLRRGPDVHPSGGEKVDTWART